VQNTKKISEIKADDYAAIFVVGGVGGVDEGLADIAARPDDRPGNGQDVCEVGRGRECHVALILDAC
jgi:putative intracellular protease/amidase